MHPHFATADLAAPGWARPEHASPADLAACRALLRGGSRSFLAASRLLPRRVRDPAVALYAFCRVADDAIDLGAEPDAALAGLRHRLDRAYAGAPLDIPADRALADVVARFGIPRALPDGLLEGFAWDAGRRRYQDTDALIAYAVRVAGTVGAMMSLLMGARTPDMIARACDLGVAMQLTNIARDVGEDARAGRLYLPLAWLREARIDPEAWLAAPTFTPALGACVQRLLDRAAFFYARADAGIARLPIGCRPGIAAARALYDGIGRVIERAGCDSVATRAVVTGRGKLACLVGALAGAHHRAPGALHTPCLPQAAFLVDAVSATRAPAGGAPEGIGFEARIVWLLGLFERLERRAQEGRAA